MWDIEVDIACVGAGIGAMASAVAGARLGGNVLVAAPSPRPGGSAHGLVVQPRVDGFLRSWEHAQLDVDTRDYFAAVTGDVTPSARPADTQLTRRTAGPMPAPAPPEGFVGSKLLDWSAQCLASPYGLLRSTAAGWRTTRMRTGDGQSVEVQTIGSIGATDLADNASFAGWMADRASESGVDVRQDCDLERIVFSDGRIVGVVLAGPGGPVSVGVRHGLAISAAADQVVGSRPLIDSPGHGELQLCVVGRVASRFLRIELIETTAAEAALRPVCGSVGRRLRGGAQALPSGAGRCRKLG